MPILLGGRFVEAVVRQLHPIVGRSVYRLGQRFRSLAKADLSTAEKNEMEVLFIYATPRQSWM